MPPPCYSLLVISSRTDLCDVLWKSGLCHSLCMKVQTEIELNWPTDQINLTLTQLTYSTLQGVARKQD